MDKENITKHYSNGEVTVVWQSGKCLHSAICINGLPGVFNTKASPWINVKNSDTQTIINQVKQCPSGALSFFMDDEQNKEAESLDVRVEVLPNGPLLVYGTLHIKDRNGNEQIRNKTTAFCRCGASQTKPFCDGSHMKIGFKDE